MFGAQFVRDDVLFTCSRDKLICVWKVPPASETDGQMAVVRPSSVLPRHNDKVCDFVAARPIRIRCDLVSMFFVSQFRLAV